MVAEDNAINQKVIMRLLERVLGCQVTVVANGLQAIEEVQKCDYDLILMDMRMPDMGGYEAATIIRAQQRVLGKRTPIVAMEITAYGREKVMEAGMDDLLIKPFHATQLRHMLEKYANPFAHINDTTTAQNP